MVNGKWKAQYWACSGIAFSSIHFAVFHWVFVVVVLSCTDMLSSALDRISHIMLFSRTNVLLVSTNCAGRVQLAAQSHFSVNRSYTVNTTAAQIERCTADDCSSTLVLIETSYTPPRSKPNAKHITYPLRHTRNCTFIAYIPVISCCTRPSSCYCVMVAPPAEQVLSVCQRPALITRTPALPRPEHLQR